MAILQGNQGQTGKQMGQNITASLGEFSEQLMTELQSRYYQQTYRGNKFTATFTAAATAAASTSALCVILNPLSSGKNLIFTDAFVALTGYTAQTLAGSSLVLGYSAAAILPTTVGTAIATQNCLLGSGAASVAKAYVSATLGVAPVAVRQLAAWALGTATPGADVVSGVHDDIGGAVILTPGNCIALFGLGGTPADLTVQTTLTWDEVYI
jgi:hypothetical protein